ncbi:MAG: hypothetical protein KatS3mg077_1760 [Candidatus Binatia bacterium]|nr:MAG: hypothetical protein KatS3mg077_1760 [Candidatus Binatia bacterium]
MTNAKPLKVRRRKDLKICRSCGQRPAKYCYMGRFRWDRRHDLCQACWRAWRDRYRPLPPRPRARIADAVVAA